MDAKASSLQLTTLAVQCLNTEQLCDIVMMMRHPQKGLQITDRRYFLKKHKKCFLACEAVKWMVKELQINEEQAKLIGNMLSSHHLIHHVSDRNRKFVDSLGSSEYFRFQSDEEGPLNWKIILHEDVVEHPCVLAQNLLRELFSIIKSNSMEDSVDVSNTIKFGLPFINFEQNVCKLQRVKLDLNAEENLSFWLNIYNMLALHAYLVATSKGCKPFDSYWSRASYFKDYRYIIRDHLFSLDDIEHGILRVTPGYFKEADIRGLYKLVNLDARIHFVLNSLNQSSPDPIIIYYKHSNLYLNYAAEQYCHQKIKIDPANKMILLPKIFKWYNYNFGSTKDNILEWVQHHLSKEQQDQLNQHQLKLYTIKYAYNWEPRITCQNCDVQLYEPDVNKDVDKLN